jgi:hypothetical protein
MPRFKRKRSTTRVRRVKKRGASLARRKATKLGKKWKSPGIPRTIVSADFQRRTQAVNFEYTQQWSVSPSIIGVANSLQFIAFTMNDPTNIFGGCLPFGANQSQSTSALPNYARPQVDYGEDAATSTVDKQKVAAFKTWSDRYEKACVIGAKVTAVLRPKMVYRQGSTDAYSIPTVTAGTTSTASVPTQDHHQFPLDASRVATILVDKQPFGTDPEAVNVSTHIPELIKRAGVKSYRMSYTPAGKDGAFCSVSYSPKKFNHLKDLKDNQRFWSDIDKTTGDLTMTNGNQPVQPVYGIVAIQKEELNSPTGVSSAYAFKKQHDYYIECKYSCTVLFKDPYEVQGSNIPTATGQAPRGHGDQMTL